MKTLVVYSSRTGNTEKVARAVAEGLHGCAIYPVKDAPNPSGYDFVAVGYWVDKGMPDADAKRYLENIENCTVALFGTLGAWPDSEHASDCKKREKPCSMSRNAATGFWGHFCVRAAWIRRWWP